MKANQSVNSNLEEIRVLGIEILIDVSFFQSDIHHSKSPLDDATEALTVYHVFQNLGREKGEIIKILGFCCRESHGEDWTFMAKWGTI